MPTVIAKLTLDGDTVVLTPVAFTANTDGFLRIKNDTSSAQTVTATCYTGRTVAYGYSGTIEGKDEDSHSLHVPIDPTITSVSVQVQGVTSGLSIDLTGKNLMSTVAIDAAGRITGPDGTANVTSTGAPLTVVNASSTTYEATLGATTSATACPGASTSPAATPLPATDQDFVTLRSSASGSTTINIRHVDKPVVVIDTDGRTQTGYPAIIAPSPDGYVYLVNLSTTPANVWMSGYANGTWTKQAIVIPGGGVYQGSLSSFDDPAHPPSPPPPNYQVSLSFDLLGDPTIAIKRPMTGGA